MGSAKHTRIIVTHYGGPDAIRVVEEECPEPKAGEVRVRVLAAGVSLPDIMAREGIHPETPPVPYTPGWDLVGVVDRLGDGTSGIIPGQVVAAMPIHGAYADFVCRLESELFPVPAGLDAAEAVSLVLNYVTAYQMLHRSAHVRSGQRALIHGAAGGVGSALLQLGRLAGLELYGTCSSRGARAVSDLGAIPIDYQHEDFAQEIHRLTGEGVDVVFDPIGGSHLWHSRRALRPGGRVVGYGNTTSLRGGGLASSRPGRRAVHPRRLASAGSEARASLQHPDAQTVEAGMVSTGPDRLARPASAEDDQAARRAAAPPVRGKTGAGVAREGRCDRQDRAR